MPSTATSTLLSLDRASVQRSLRVVDGDGHPVPGHPSLDQDALVWVFTPAVGGNDWKLRIDTRLEDLAGNSVRRVFDRDLRRPADDGIDASNIFLTSNGKRHISPLQR